MNVKLLQGLSGSFATFEPGEVADFHAGEAKRLIAAEICEETKDVVTKDTARKQAKAKRLMADYQKEQAAKEAKLTKPETAVDNQEKETAAAN